MQNILLCDNFVHHSWKTCQTPSWAPYSAIFQLYQMMRYMPVRHSLTSINYLISFVYSLLAGKRDRISLTNEHLHWLPLRYVWTTNRHYSITHAQDLSIRWTNLFSQLVDFIPPVRSLRSSDSHLLAVPKRKLACTSHAFSIAAPRL